MSEMLFTERGWADYVYWEKQDRKTLSRINQLLQSIGREGVLDGSGHPERMRYKTDAYSRRIDSKNRLIYKYESENDRVIIESCRGHYDDK